MSHVGIVVQDAASKKDSSRASAGQKIRLLVSWDVARVTGKPAEKVTWAIIYGGRIVKSDFVADTAQAGAWSWGRRWVVAKDWARGRYTAVGIVVVANHATRVTRAFTVVK